jgi:hypothetical protein
MKTNPVINTCVCRAALFALALAFLDTNFSLARAQGTAFTYQGRLNLSGSPANGVYDFTFTLFGVSSGGSTIAGPVTNAAVAVTNGLFTTTLDLGANFTGADRWLGIGVRTNGSGAFSALSPRQQITSTPYAIQSANAASAVSVSGSVSAAQLTGTIQPGNIGAGTITSVMLAPDSVHSNHLALGSIHSNHLALASIHSNHLAVGSVHSNALALGSVTATALADGSIHSNHLAVGSVHSNALVIGSIHSNHLAVGSVHSNALALGSVTASALANDSIHSNHLAVGSVHSNALALGSVTATALADGSIHSNHLAVGSIHSNALALGSVTATALADGSIHSNHLAVGSIHSNALALGSVTATALADGSIHSNSLAVGAVSPDKLTASLSGSFSTTVTDPTPGFFENFGVAVGSVGTDKLLIGAYQDSTGGDNAGAAYLLSTGGTLVRTFLSPAPQNQEHFGFAVASLGQDKVLIGADGNSVGGLNSGAAYLFGTNGTLITTFTNPTPAASDFFGYSVAAVGADKVLIGAHGDHFGANAGGAAYLFGTNRTLLTTFTNPTPASGDRFGIAVAVVGADKVLIGADRDDVPSGGGTDAGVAYLFHVSGTLLATFTNPTPAVGDAFGSAVTGVGSDQVLIGTPGDNSGGNAGGAAYLFNTSGTLLTTLTNPTPASGDQFGIAVAAVGANNVLIGAASDDSGATDAGGAYLFSTDGTLLWTFHNPAPANGDLFGNAVTAVGTDKILIGAFQDDAGPTDSGAAYLFALESYTPGLLADTVKPGSITTSRLDDGAVTLQKLDSSIGVWTRAGNNVYRSTGNVGIGTTLPVTPLHVEGNNSQLRLHDSFRGNFWHIYTENHPNPAISGNLLFFPGPTGMYGFIQKSSGNYFSSSDARLKQDVRGLGGVLDRVLQLRPVTYRFKSAPGSAPRTIGLIAQDVEPLFPEAVGEHDGMKSLAYSELVPVTVGAIQELNQKVEERANRLERELKRRDAENAELRQTVGELKEIVKAMKQKFDGGAKITPAAP